MTASLVSPEWTSVLPPVVAIGLAVTTRQVYTSLFAGIWLGWGLVAWEHGASALGAVAQGLRGGVEGAVGVFGDAGNTRVILFSALVGAVIAFTTVSGGVAGFVRWVTERGGVTTRRRAALLSWTLGVVVFIESSITSLVNGAVSRPVFDRLRMSREKLAYLCDSTAAPVCILIPLNAWGAYLVQLLAREGYEDPLGALLATMPANFYAITALGLSLAVAWFGWDIGPMRRAERRAQRAGSKLDEAMDETGDAGGPAGNHAAQGADACALAPRAGGPRRARDLVVPVLALVMMMPVGLAVTGDGDILAGSGSTAVLWAVLVATGVAAAMAIQGGALSQGEAGRVFFRGVGDLLPLAALMVLAFAIGDVTRALGTGIFVASWAGDAIPTGLMPAALFALSAFIAFATGTSWGTFAIMIPIAAPLAAHGSTLDTLAVAAVLSGGIFGDHASPISDTTLIASMAAGSDHIAHVNTQLPYALLAAGASLALFTLAGLAA